VKDLGSVIKTVEKFTVDNAPLILTVIGATGTVTTAYLTAKATFQAAKKIQDKQFIEHLHVPANEHKNTEMSNTDKVKLVWTCYIPPAAAGVGTVTAIIYSNRISSRRAAAMAAAYSISQKAYDEYKEKIVEKLGVTKEQKARDEIAQDRLDRNPPGDNVIIAAGGEVLCLDQFTGRYFKSDMETLKKAQNDTNYQILSRDYASLSDFYDRVGLPATSFSEEVGWNADKKCELLFSTVLAPDGKPCISFDFDISPIRNYYRCHVE